MSWSKNRYKYKNRGLTDTDDIFLRSGKDNKIFSVTGKSRKNIDNMFPVSEKDDKMFPNSDKGKKKPLKSAIASLK